MAVNPELWLYCWGIKTCSDSGKEMESPGVPCGCRLHPMVEEQADVSVD